IISVHSLLTIISPTAPTEQQEESGPPAAIFCGIFLVEGGKTGRQTCGMTISMMVLWSGSLGLLAVLGLAMKLRLRWQVMRIMAASRLVPMAMCMCIILTNPTTVDCTGGNWKGSIPLLNRRFRLP